MFGAVDDEVGLMLLNATDAVLENVNRLKLQCTRANTFDETIAGGFEKRPL